MRCRRRRKRRRRAGHQATLTGEVAPGQADLPGPARAVRPPAAQRGAPQVRAALPRARRAPASRILGSTGGGSMFGSASESSLALAERLRQAVLRTTFRDLAEPLCTAGLVHGARTLYTFLDPRTRGLCFITPNPGLPQSAASFLSYEAMREPYSGGGASGKLTTGSRSASTASGRASDTNGCRRRLAAAGR